MKKLLNTLYITNKDYYLALDGENIVVKQEGDVIGRFPLHNLQSVLCFHYMGVSPALLAACCKRGIDLVFLTNSGQFGARVVGASYGNVLLRRTQYRWADQAEKSLDLAKSFLLGKIYNCHATLARTIRDHGLRVDVPALEGAKQTLKQSLAKIPSCQSLQQLLGIEGEAAQQYFRVFPHLILQQQEDFRFSGRSKRPPLDPTNALLSFFYMILAKDCAAALESVGLDSYVGFLHQDRPGRTSLALDLLEEFRAVMVDRFVLTLINRKQVSAADFLYKENGAVLIQEDARKKLLAEWQTRKKVEIKHPFLREKVEWGMLPYVQALLLARYLRGDLDAYPPFFWK